ncbi:hypothetical protein WH47_06186 [Habropoda laboriosa]|uniref:Uncharacterized protein n=1 Tax=Habropoda laboriosa TaxID=597456 RepID=A0A0L7QT82_9HYME|nr:hypothetical protein WH47_06186 [Habropoda laboriosa]
MRSPACQRTLRREKDTHIHARTHAQLHVRTASKSAWDHHWKRVGTRDTNHDTVYFRVACDF